MKPLLLLGLLPVSFYFFATQRSAEPVPVPVEQEPHHHTVLKNDYVLVMHVTLPEGEQSLYHMHSHDRASIALSNTNFSQQKLNEPEGPSAPAQPGSISASTTDGTPWIHRVHNLGPGVFDVLDIEFLQRPGQPSPSTAGTVVAENPSARIYKWILAPGTSSAMHTHNRPYLIIAVNNMPLKMTAPDGQSFAHEVQPGDFHWVASKVTHSLTNEGAAEGQIVEIELK
jgi:quercetin dioxygenase-like cupin family protein